MTPTADDSRERAPLLEADLRDYFERLWRHPDRREARAANDDVPGRVKLGCTGELVAVDSIAVAVVRSSADGADTVEFICPCCERLHESIAVR